MDRRTLLMAGIASLSAGPIAKAQTEVRQLPPAAPAGAPAPAYDAPAAAPAYAAPGAAPAYGAPPANSPPVQPGPSRNANFPAETQAQTYSREEIVNTVSDFMGVTAESAGGAVERIFAQNGRPTAYIAGEELSGAFGFGLRYGRGLLYMKDRPPIQVYWQGPSIGWDVGGNGSRVFTLCYNLQVADAIYQRFPGVEGSAYFIGGLGVNYQRASDITLAPIRAGVGLRLGAGVGYLAYTRQRNILPF